MLGGLQRERALLLAAVVLASNWQGVLGSTVLWGAVLWGPVLGGAVLSSSVLLLCIHRQSHGDAQLYLVPELWLLL